MPSSSASWNRPYATASSNATRPASPAGNTNSAKSKTNSTTNWLWTVRRQTTPSPGGLLDKGTRGKRARYVPLIVVADLGYEHLRRHALRHTGLTWMADAAIPVHVLRVIAGHGSLTTTQRYLHPDRRSITAAGDALTAHLRAPRSPSGPQHQAM